MPDFTKKPIECTYENLETALNSLSPNLPREEWVQIAFALEDGCRNARIDGLKLFDSWSSGGATYRKSDVVDVWRSLKPGATTVATLWDKALKAGWRPSKEAGNLESILNPGAREELPADARQFEREQAAAKAMTLWKAASPVVTNNPYLERKAVNPTATLREIDATEVHRILGYRPKAKDEPLDGILLLVPVAQGDELTTIELIDSDGRKTALKDGKKAGCYWSSRQLPIEDPQTIYIAEGVATALTVAQAMDSIAIASLSCGNLPAVAKNIRSRFPTSKIIITGDIGNGQSKAAEAAEAVNGSAVFPTFTTGSGTDFNDLAVAEGIEVVRKQILFPGARKESPPPKNNLRFTLDEIEAAKLSPPCIVENYLFQDVAVLAAPGGAGKTTIIIREAVAIALGGEIWGLRVHKTGWTLVITAEDSREIFAARLREIIRALNLSESEKMIAIQSLCVWDVSGFGLKLIKATDGNLILSGLADEIIKTYKDDPPVMVVFDPLISFGADETRVNDNEQNLITAARRIMRGLNCCVRLIHHVGKGNAREKTLDQYTGRGGSALADGARMVAVIQPWDDEQSKPLPDLCTIEPGSTVVALARPKISYAPAQGLIFIKRTGWKFEYFYEQPPKTKEETKKSRNEQLLRFLEFELKQGRYHTKRSLEDGHTDLGMSRDDVRSTISTLIASILVRDEELPHQEKKGRRQTFLCPSHIPYSAEGFRDIEKIPDETSPDCADSIARISIARPIGELIRRDIARLDYPPVFSNAPRESATIRDNRDIKESKVIPTETDTFSPGTFIEIDDVIYEEGEI
ncbi:regulatory protein RepA [Gammaproteobacteria bacterium]